MTRVAIRSGRAVALDGLDLDALALPMFRARVQPRGVAGHVDWRLCGRIANLLRSDRFRGDAGEALLMPAGGRIGPQRVFLFGLGSARAPSAEVRGDLAPIVAALADAGADRHGVGFPVIPGAAPDAEQASAVEWASAWLEAAATRRGQLDEVVLLDEDGRLERDAARLRERARDLGLTWGA